MFTFCILEVNCKGFKEEEFLIRKKLASKVQEEKISGVYGFNREWFT